MAGAIGILLITATIVVILWWWAGARGLEGKDLVSAQLDAVKTGLGVGVGVGGGFGLYLAWRRQRSTEADLDNRERALSHQQITAADAKAHQERVAAATEADATARRITDLYAKAADQLGSDKAPVRLAGLYSLERVAQDNPGQRQTIVNVLCAYLRMPFGLIELPEDDSYAALTDAHLEYIQETEVRLTAQRILAHHLRPGSGPNPASTFWPDIDLDLNGATLIDLSLDNAAIRTAHFKNASFYGTTCFNKTRFIDATEFQRADFGKVMFRQATFEKGTQFGDTQFRDDASFRWALFKGTTSFKGARFNGRTIFEDVRINAPIVRFNGTHFREKTIFANTEFNGTAYFNDARFDVAANFLGARFSQAIPPEVQEFLQIAQTVYPSTRR